MTDGSLVEFQTRLPSPQPGGVQGTQAAATAHWPARPAGLPLSVPGLPGPRCPLLHGVGGRLRGLPEFRDWGAHPPGAEGGPSRGWSRGFPQACCARLHDDLGVRPRGTQGLGGVGGCFSEDPSPLPKAVQFPPGSPRGPKCTARTWGSHPPPGLRGSACHTVRRTHSCLPGRRLVTAGSSGAGNGPQSMRCTGHSADKGGACPSVPPLCSGSPAAEDGRLTQPATLPLRPNPQPGLRAPRRGV